jgi:hypothetical protein
LTKAHRFNPSSATEESNHRVLGIDRYNRHGVGERNVGLGGRIIENHTRQGTNSKVALMIMDVLVFRLYENRTQVRRGILMERHHKLETKHGSKAEMNLHGYNHSS